MELKIKYYGSNGEINGYRPTTLSLNTNRAVK